MADCDWRPFVYGGIASCAAEFSTFPLDTTKTRLQIQGQKHDLRHMKLKYHGVVDAIWKISVQEGPQAFYAGIHPAVLRQATYGTIKFGTYYSLKRLIGQGKEEHLLLNVWCATIAGIVSSCIANPADVVKVRMQVLGVRTANVLECFKDVYRLEGVAGLWRGVGPTAQRAAVIAAVELPVYDMCKQKFRSKYGDGIKNYFMSSVIAGLASALVSTPIDVIRTRLMNQRKFKHVTNAQIYGGAIDCLLKTVRSEGFLALYKGFLPTWLRMGPWNTIFFITYEQLKFLF